MKLQLLKISRGPGGWIGSVRGKTENRLHQVNKAAVSLVKASPASLASVPKSRDLSRTPRFWTWTP